MSIPPTRRIPVLLAVLLTTVLYAAATAEPAAQEKGIPFQQETLPNGLNVIYAPMNNAPVVHVRVLYHVGSRDERPDRQGFAHMFEHMMFRGSAHVQPEEHMKLINMVGGISNAFTSFDQTAYVNTIPSNYTEMALYLEADRMASFKVSEEIYKVERNVVAKEWGIRQNQPYGTVFEEFLKNAFTKHSYRWTPIGNMDHLRAAPVNDLQEFFNKYYVPNNATLVVAGDIDVEKTKEMVRKYFGWIPKGPDVKRDIPEEPEQTEPRRVVVPKVVPLPMVYVGWHTPEYRSPDQDVLSVLASILGDGRSSRLDRLMVNSDRPIAASAGAGNWQLEDKSVLTVSARLLPGKSADEAERMLREAVDDVVKNGVSDDELAKVKQSAKVGLARSRETAEQIAGALAEEAVFGGDANRVNTALERIERVTAADVQRVAKQYLRPERATTMHVVPDPTGAQQRKNATTQVAELAQSPVVPATKPVEPRAVQFPEGYPQRPPMGDPNAAVEYAKGVESEVNGVKVIVMEDHRLPLVNWSLTMRRGSHLVPKGKEGLGGLTASMLRRGVKGMSFEELNRDLEGRAVTVEVSDGGDFTRLFGSAMSDQLEHGITRSRQVLLEPTFPAEELGKLKEQAVAGLRDRLANPGSVAERVMAEELYGDSALGRDSTFESIASVTLEDVKQFYQQVYRPQDAFLTISGDVTVERGRELARKLLEGWETGPVARPDYALPEAPAKRRIILVDNPEGKQSVVRMGIRAYDVQSPDRFAGTLAGQILSSGIESRLGRYVRAEKGYAYGVVGYFRPGRQAGEFAGSTETAFETTAAAIEAMWKVFDDMRAAEVMGDELADAKMRVNGSMVMGVQTIQQQADMRGRTMLNGYPVDYYDRLPTFIGKVTSGEVRDVVRKYVEDERMVIVVVAPAEKVREQLEKLGEVEVQKMPELPEGGKKEELLKKAA